MLRTRMLGLLTSSSPLGIRTPQGLDGTSWQIWCHGADGAELKMDPFQSRWRGGGAGQGGESG